MCRSSASSIARAGSARPDSTVRLAQSSFSCGTVLAGASEYSGDTELYFNSPFQM